MIRHLPSSAAIAFSVLLASCGGDNEFVRAHRVGSFNEAGTIHIAALPASNFRSIAESMKPRFETSKTDALRDAVPTTTYVEEQLLNALIAAVGIAPPRTSVTGARSDGTATAPTPAATPALPARPDLRTDRTKPPEGKADTAKTALPVDPLLKQATAAAIYQYSRLIDSAVAAVAARNDVVPVLVPINVNVKPYARFQPYDAYLTIGFFANLVERQDLSGGICAPAGVVRDNTADSATTPVMVTPLLVTDNVEGVQTARTAEVLTQFAFAFNALIGGFGIDAKMTKVRDELRAALGTDLNSLLTVGRATDNTLSVRIGGQRSPVSGYAMVPRNSTVYAIVLVPRKFAASDNALVKIVSKASLRDAETGKALPFDSATRLRAYQEILPRVVPDAACRAKLLPNSGSPTERIATMEDIRGEVQQQNFTEAARIINDACGRASTSSYANALWVALAEIAGASDFQSTSVPLGQCLVAPPPGRTVR